MVRELDPIEATERPIANLKEVQTSGGIHDNFTSGYQAMEALT